LQVTPSGAVLLPLNPAHIACGQEKTIVYKNLRRATMPFDKEKQVTLIFQGCQTAR
jgi:hypothetical protein